MPESAQKLETLKQLLGSVQSAVVAFSGGVDSTFLAWAAREVYGKKLLLVTATSSTYPFFELDQARSLATDLGINHRVIVSEEIDIPGFADNPPDRCYYCKSELFTKICALALAEGYAAVYDGSNADDTADFRPGRRALSEQGIRSPLQEADLTKDEIRALSRAAGLPTASKPSYACLASRFPYGETITREKLDRVGSVELAVRALEFGQFRVRSHGDLARLEFNPQELDRAFLMRENLDAICRKAGFTYVALDLRGYRTGAMNETLSESVKQASLEGQ